MSAYINTETLEYPLFQGDVMLALGVSYEEFTLAHPFAAVVPAELPELPSKKHYFVENKPTLVNGKWLQQLELRERTDAQQRLYEQNLDRINVRPKQLPTTTL
jgi:hypothetical protein